VAWRLFGSVYGLWLIVRGVGLDAVGGCVRCACVWCRGCLLVAVLVVRLSCVFGCRFGCRGCVLWFGLDVLGCGAVLCYRGHGMVGWAFVGRAFLCCGRGRSGVGEAGAVLDGVPAECWAARLGLGSGGWSGGAWVGGMRLMVVPGGLWASFVGGGGSGRLSWCGGRTLVAGFASGECIGGFGVLVGPRGRC